MPKGVYERKSFSKQHCKHLSEAHIGVKLSVHHRSQIGLARLGTKRSAETCKKLREFQEGDKHYRWITGIPTNYFTIHGRIVKLYGKADHCENPKCPNKSKDFHWSNKKHDYKTLSRKDWWMLCASCHRVYDCTNRKLKERIT